MGNRRNVKVTPYMVLDIRREYAEGKTQPWLARKYGIGPGQVGRIVRGEAWTQITDGNPVVTEQDAQLRYLTTPQGPLKEEAEASFAKVQRMLAQEQSAPSTQDILERRARGRETTAVSDYARMMVEAEVAADSIDGTARVSEHVVARIEKTLADSRPAINAEKLLETLKDEHTQATVSPAKPE